MVIDFLCSWWLPVEDDRRCVCVLFKTSFSVIMTNNKNNFEMYRRKKRVFLALTESQKASKCVWWERERKHDQFYITIRTKLGHQFRRFIDYFHVSSAFVSVRKFRDRLETAQACCISSDSSIRWGLAIEEHLKLMATVKKFSVRLRGFNLIVSKVTLYPK